MVIKVMFVCHGNICRSPMAEFVFKELVKRQGLENEFLIQSSATSLEEIGNPVHSGTKKKLGQHGITCEGKVSVQLRSKDYIDFDYIVAMDQNNIKNMVRLIGEDLDHKVSLLMDYTMTPRGIADPWYTGDFEQTYQDVYLGCEGLLDHILRNRLR